MNSLIKKLQIGKERVTVVIKKDRLIPSNHHFVFGKDGYLYMDKLRVMGLDSLPIDKNPLWSHLYHIVGFTVYWRGRIIDVPYKYYLGVISTSPEITELQYSLDTSNNSFFFNVSEERDALFISTGGGDGGASFTAWWIIKLSGEVLLFTEGPP